MSEEVVEIPVPQTKNVTVLQGEVNRDTARFKNVKEAVAEAVNSVKLLPEFESLSEDLIRAAVSFYVYQTRARQTRIIKNLAVSRHDAPENDREEGGDEAPAPKPSRKPASRFSPSGAASAVPMYKIFIGGFMLGDMTGEQLDEAKGTEAAKAAGFLRNVEFLAEIRKNVGRKEVVRRKLSEGQLADLWNKVVRK